MIHSIRVPVLQLPIDRHQTVEDGNGSDSVAGQGKLGDAESGPVEVGARARVRLIVNHVCDRNPSTNFSFWNLQEGYHRRQF